MKQQHRESGVITLEAAMMVPMFIAIMLCLNGLFVMFMGQQIISHAAIQSAKSLALDPYATDCAASDKGSSLTVLVTDLFSIGNKGHMSTEKWYSEKQGKLLETVEERFVAYLTPDKSTADSLLETIGVENGLDGISFEGSKVEDDVLTLNISYKQRYVFMVGDITSHERKISLRVKLFRYIT